MRYWVITIAVLCWLAAPAHAEQVLMSPQAYIKQQFDGTIPKPKVIWLTKALKTKVADILNHDYAGLRVRYWQGDGEQAQQTVWVLSEIGKEKNITVGITIIKQRIASLNVLVYRESRGWEVKYDFFTHQFRQLFLQDGEKLNKSIDGITGATLSVRAVKKLARIALLLDKEVQG
ncbi:MAG: FMN-binding protein [Ghiorsea sp.]|nr:FMN-binding protein [Ghiorsea sp.]